MCVVFRSYTVVPNTRMEDEDYLGKSAWLEGNLIIPTCVFAIIPPSQRLTCQEAQRIDICHCHD
jgi:hypothetical protein